jgi:ribosomal protein S18 acetylase RimI-like enzyme
MRTNLRIQLVDDEQTSPSAIRTLEQSDLAEVVEFLAADPVRGVHLHGMVADNGLESPANRGTFYGCYSGGRLSGVALLGHNILMCGDEAARAKFAELAISTRAKGHLVFGPAEEVKDVAERMIEGGRETNVVHDLHWVVCEKPHLPLKRLQMRRANAEELDVVATAQAEMVTEECGVDPRETDPVGFKQRVADRIKKGRVWCRVEDDRVIFKVDLISVSPDAVYLEGVWTHPDYRGRGIAKGCMNELTYRLLRQYKHVCLFVEPDDAIARRIYESIGFVHTMDYRSHYLQPMS